MQHLFLPTLLDLDNLSTTCILQCAQRVPALDDLKDGVGIECIILIQSRLNKETYNSYSCPVALSAN